MALGGVDLLGIASRYWPMKETLAAGIAKGTPIGVFINNTFGPNGVKNSIKLIQDIQCSKFRFGIWTDHVLIKAKQLINICKKCEAIAVQFPATNFYLCFTTEHKCRDEKKLRALMAIIRQHAPHCIPVNNPLPGYKVLSGECNESHGDDPLPGQYIASMDGRGFEATDFNAFQFVKRHQSAIMVLSWCGLFNMNDGNQPKNPALRKSGPSAHYIRAALAASFYPGVAPLKTFSGKVTPVVAPLVYKNMSGGTGDHRENKPLIINTSQAPALKVITFDGKVLGHFPFFDDFLGKWQRHYSTGVSGGGMDLWGYEILQRAIKASGCGWIWFTDGKNIFGPVYPPYRVGMFQPPGRKE
jgi:hypothetical protein